MLNLTLDNLIGYLGQPEKKISGEYVWQCPYCRDSHKDNLKYNEQKGLLMCFANNDHARQIISCINKQSCNNYSKIKKNLFDNPLEISPQLSEKQYEDNLDYMLKCNVELLKNEKALNHIKHKRGIKTLTVDACGIGIDKEKHTWVFPIFKYSTNDVKIIGFEYRPPLLPNAIKEKRTEAEKNAKKGITRKKGSISGMAMINCMTPKVEILTIVEGFLDGYALFQYLIEQEQFQYYQIVTPSNGIGSLLNQISEIDFKLYKEVYLYVDFDEKSRPVAEKILIKYPFIKTVKLSCNCKDFNEHYVKCIKGNNNDKI